MPNLWMDIPLLDPWQPFPITRSRVYLLLIWFIGRDCIQICHSLSGQAQLVNCVLSRQQQIATTLQALHPGGRAPKAATYSG